MLPNLDQPIQPVAPVPSVRSIPYNVLTPEEEHILLRKGTEIAGTGLLLHNKSQGTYLCKQCDTPLYDSDDKFESHCGWPSFDDEIEGAVIRLPDVDGRRTEIICGTCGGHLGHVFLGEKMTLKDTRHCVNSLSMKFVPGVRLRAAFFASGCFWGTEYFFRRTEGVKFPSELYPPTTVGYMGGKKTNPTYKDVCTGTTGHAETLCVIYDMDKTDYETLVRLFFETHDFTQVDRQGPDIGPQYRSMIFYVGDSQQKMAAKYVALLKSRGYSVATKLEPAGVFWPAEMYHQQYFDIRGQIPTCHVHRSLFD